MIALEHIEEAHRFIDPVFLETPQFRADGLSRALGMNLVVKVECVNPIRSFKGRGACYFAHRHAGEGRAPWVCASAGNFGQALAYAASKRGIPLVVFASNNANPFKLARMRELGAEVRLHGSDFDEAKQEARRYAEANELPFVEDGREPSITEGAGSLAVELLRYPEPFDTLLVPLGNGALINGVGVWVKAKAPSTRVIGAGTVRAPAMARSFRERRPVSLEEPVESIADGVAARVSVPEAVETMLRCVDDVLLVEESAIVEAMATVEHELGLKVEGAGAVGLAVATVHQERFRNQRVAVVITGSNLSTETKRSRHAG